MTDQTQATTLGATSLGATSLGATSLGATSLDATRLGAAFIPPHLDALTPNDVTSYRAVSNQRGTADKLGPLKDLPGFWEGTGFSLIARPDFSGSDNGFFLELNWLRETIEFTTIGSPVFNRGSRQDDIKIYGLTYLHRVTDGMTGGALHIEPGLWLNIPATTDPKADASIARLASVPHGNAINTIGFAEDVDLATPPVIPPANTVPYEIGGAPPPPGTRNPYPEYDLSIESKFRSSPLPTGLTQAVIDDPHVLQRAALKGQNIQKIVRLFTNTRPGGGIENIPFITRNADNPSLESLFVIETVRSQTGEDFLQLQYSQTALLNFNGMSFPHVTVGTLIKAF